MAPVKRISDISSINVESKTRDIALQDPSFHAKKIRRLPVGFLKGVTSLKITSPYGFRKIRGNISMHRGVDIATPTGTEIYLDGIVRFIQPNDTGHGGKYIAIERDGFLFIFMHLSEVNYYHKGNPNGLKIGQHTSRSSKPNYLGKTGNSGRSSGPHLHFQVNNRIDIRGIFSINPIAFLYMHDLSVRVKSSGLSLTRRAIVPTDFSSHYDLVHDPEVYKSRSGSAISYSANETNAIINSEIVDESATEQERKPKLNPLERGNPEGKLAKGIWQITNLIVDRLVEDKQVIDSSISSLQGSLINYFKKICQEPFVEFSGDTYGNQYYWFMRRMPYDRLGYLELMGDTNITIPIEDVISSSLKFSNGSDIYSWYQLLPTMEVMGMSKINYYIQSIFFPEFASFYGSKSLVIQSNYYEYKKSGRFQVADSEEYRDKSSILMRQCIQDLRYLIESNAYNAFVRSGTITVIGDRRIKRGTCVSLGEEVFIVDSVSNSFSINNGAVERTTTLQVSRGMIMAFLDKNWNDHKVSYFDIIDFGKDDSGKEIDLNDVTIENCKEYLSKWKVNFQSFHFFLNRQQFKYVSE